MANLFSNVTLFFLLCTYLCIAEVNALSTFQITKLHLKRSLYNYVMLCMSQYVHLTHFYKRGNNFDVQN